MRPVSITRTLASAVANGIAQAQAVGAGASLTLNGSLVSSGVAQLGAQRQVIMASGDNISTVVFTITGTDQAGNTISDTITGISGSTVATTLNFLTVTRISAATSTGASTVTAGTNGVGASQTIPLDVYLPYGNTATVVVSGTLNYSVQVSNSDPFGDPSTPLSWVSYPDSAVVAKTATATGVATSVWRAARLLTNSGTGTGTFIITQQGLMV